MNVTAAKQLYCVFIKAPPQSIWDAITDSSVTPRYFHGARVEAELKPGGKFNYHAPSGLCVDGRVVECDPPRRLVATWHALWTDQIASEKASRVTWEIEPKEGGYCKVTLTHDELEQSPLTADHVKGEGWMYVLSGLKTWVETGASLRAA